jgi:hypothetical protein
MNHDQAALLLPEYLQGQLDRSDREAVAAHLAGCEECAALARTHRVLAEALAEPAAAGLPEHPGSDEIVAYAVNGARMSTPDLARIGAHLQRCDSCRRAVDATREAEIHLRRGSGAGRSGLAGLLARFRGHGGLAMAAGLTLLLLGGAALVPFYRAPRMNAVIEELRAENLRLGSEIVDLRGVVARSPREWGGAVHLPVFTSAARGAKDRLRVEVREGQPSIPIVVVPPDLEALPDAASLRLEIRQDMGPVAWDYTQTVREAREAVTEANLLTFSVPASRLTPGSYVLTLTTGSSPTPLLLVPFDAVSAN